MKISFIPLFVTILAALLQPVRAEDVTGKVAFAGAYAEMSADGSYWIKETTGELLASTSSGAITTIIPNGEMTVDASGIDPSPEKKDKCTVRFYPKVEAAEYANKQFAVDVVARADKPIAARLYIEGQAGGKHFYKDQDIQVTDKSQTLTCSTRLPLDIEKVWVRFDCAGAAFTFTSASCREIEEKVSVESGRNWVINGGAERGWYGTGIVNYGYTTIADKCYNWAGDATPKWGNWSLDETDRHSGKRSFRSDSIKTSRLYFDPVSFIPGKDSHLSAWIKAEKPGTQVGIGLFVANGIAYGKGITAGPEWKEYTLDIPSWGAEVPSVNRIGEVVGGYGCVFGQAYPSIDANGNGRVWVDDVTYYLGNKGVPADADALLLRGQLNKESACYKPGEEAVAKIEIENTTDQTRTVSLIADTLDYFGKSIERRNIGKFPVKAGATESKEIPVTANFLGSGNFVIEATDKVSGKIYKHVFYLGRIGKDEAKVGRLGVNVGWGQNNEEQSVIPYLNDFRIGSVRVWSMYSESLKHFFGLDDVPIFKKAGLYVLFNLGFDNDLLFAPRDLTSWQSFLKKELPPVRDMVDAYEILNEPNIWAGRIRNPDPARFDEMNVAGYARALQAGAETIHEIDPHALIAGPATCHTDVNFTASVLATEPGRKQLDIVTEHPYRNSPEVPDYGDDLNCLKEIIRKNVGKDLPLMATEVGCNTGSMFVENRIDDNMRNSVAQDMRTMLIAFASGCERYFLFDASLVPCGTQWNFFLLGNPGNGCKVIPNPVFYAMRTVADQLGDAKPLGRITLGLDYRCYVFDQGKKRTVCVWKWNGKPCSLNMTGWKKTTQARDLMGNPVPLENLQIGTSPIYLQTSLSFQELETKFAMLNLEGVGSPVAVSTTALNAHQFEASVLNRTSKPISGVIEMLDEKGAILSKHNFEKIAPEKTSKFIFAAANEITVTGQTARLRTRIQGFSEPTTENFSLRTMLCPRATSPIEIDGDLSGWPQQKAVTLDASNVIMQDPALWNDNDKKIKAEIVTCWDDEYLYVGVTVHKAIFHPDDVSVASLHNGDSLQIAFDPLKNAAPNGEVYGNDDFEYALALWNGKPTVYRAHSSSAVYDGLQKNVGLLNDGEVKFAVHTVPGETVYEMAFPRISVSPFRFIKGESMRWSLLVNLNNGQGRMGWLELTPGIGKSKDPSTFMDMVLVK